MQVRLEENKKAEGDFREAVRSLWAACQNQTKSSKSVKLPATMCRQMLRVVHVVGWFVAEELNEIPIGDGSTQSPTSFVYCANPRRSIEYTGYLTEDPTNAVGLFNSSFVFLGPWSRSPRYMEKAVKRIISDMIFSSEFPALP